MEDGVADENFWSGYKEGAVEIIDEVFMRRV